MNRLIEGPKELLDKDSAAQAHPTDDANSFAEKDPMMQTSIRVEPIDNRHPSWREVLNSIFRSGNQHALMLSDDGWLSSRQTVLAAFDGPSVVGHLCFRLEAARSPLGHAVVRSKVDSFSVERAYTAQDVEEMLLQTAETRARLMQCPSPRVGFAAAC